LGDAYYVVEEGLPGRSMVFHDPTFPERTRKAMLLPCVDTHKPLNLIIIMLGANDCQIQFRATAEAISDGLKDLIHLLRGHYPPGRGMPPEILIVSPVCVGDQVEESWGKDAYDRRSARLSETLGSAFKAAAEANGCHFLDGSRITSPDADDGVHLNEAGHLALTAALEGMVRKILSAS
jgi:lysophospholipase L1-like esterase